jgi:hypothetical protein
MLAGSMVLAGMLGSSVLPRVAEALEMDGETPFTIIGNNGAITLAKTAC